MTVPFPFCQETKNKGTTKKFHNQAPAMHILLYTNVLLRHSSLNKRVINFTQLTCHMIFFFLRSGSALMLVLNFYFYQLCVQACYSLVFGLWITREIYCASTPCDFPTLYDREFLQLQQKYFDLNDFNYFICLVSLSKH